MGTGCVKGESMKTITAHSAWSWLHEEQFESGQTRFTRLLAEFQRRPMPRDGPEGAIIRPEQTGPTVPIALEDVDFSLDDFIFADDAVSPFQVSGRFELGGEFAFDGEVQLLPGLDLSGSLDVDDLAIALLKDSDGVITFDIPVQGNVNDPEFSFGPAIREALELPAPYASDADYPALQRQRARAAMVELLDQAGIDVANPSLKAAETSETLEAMFADRYPQRTLADVRERFTTTAEDEAPEFDAAAYREHLATEVTAAQTVTEEELEALAQARADAVRNFILGEGEAPAIESDRVRSVAPIEVEANGTVVLEIGLAAGSVDPVEG